LLTSCSQVCDTGFDEAVGVADGDGAAVPVAVAVAVGVALDDGVEVSPGVFVGFGDDGTQPARATATSSAVSGRAARRGRMPTSWADPAERTPRRSALPGLREPRRTGRPGPAA
jgi:hypothetical protein